DSGARCIVEYISIAQQPFKSIERIAPLPLFDFIFGHVPGSVCVRVPMHAHSLRFDDRWSKTASCPSEAETRFGIDIKHIIAGDSCCRNGVGGGSQGKIIYGGSAGCRS